MTQLHPVGKCTTPLRKVQEAIEDLTLCFHPPGLDWCCQEFKETLQGKGILQRWGYWTRGYI
jgi:hypothetical protein